MRPTANPSASPSASATSTNPSAAVTSRHTSSHESAQSSPGSTSSWYSSQSSRRTSRSCSVAGRMDTEACQQVMGGQVLEGRESCADRAHVFVRTIERGDGLAQSEVAPRPRLRPGEVAGEEPVGRPLAEPALCDELRLDLVIAEEREPVEIEPASGETEDVLGFAAREADRDELVIACQREPLSGRKRVGVFAANAERRDQAVPDGERGEQGNLLGADRGDKRLEGIGREWRTEARECRNETREHGLRRSERVETVEVELQPEELAHDRFGPRIERLDADTAVCALDPHLPPVDDSLEAALVPEIREVGPERAVPLGRELEVVRRRKPENPHAPTVEKRVRPKRLGV